MCAQQPRQRCVGEQPPGMGFTADVLADRVLLCLLTFLVCLQSTPQSLCTALKSARNAGPTILAYTTLTCTLWPVVTGVAKVRLACRLSTWPSSGLPAMPLSLLLTPLSLLCLCLSAAGIRQLSAACQRTLEVGPNFLYVLCLLLEVTFLNCRLSTPLLQAGAAFHSQPH
jgi:hypothetical protein